MRRLDRRLDLLLAAALVAILVLPWYRIETGFFGLGWLARFLSDPGLAPLIVQILGEGRWWLVPGIGVLAAAGAVRVALPAGGARGRWLIGVAGLGLAWMIAEGLAIGFRGWNWELLQSAFGELATGQPAFGAGTLVLGLCFVMLLAFGQAERGAMKGDAFSVTI